MQHRYDCHLYQQHQLKYMQFDACQWTVSDEQKNEEKTISYRRSQRTTDSYRQRRRVCVLHSTSQFRSASAAISPHQPQPSVVETSLHGRQPASQSTSSPSRFCSQGGGTFGGSWARPGKAWLGAAVAHMQHACNTHATRMQHTCNTHATQCISIVFQ